MSKRTVQISGFVLAVVISVLIFIFRDRLPDLRSYGYFGLFILSILGNATIILPVPSILTAFVGGAVLNPVLVTLVTASGATIGELTGYLAGLTGEEIINRDIKIQKAAKWMEKYGLWTIFILAAVPNPFFDLAGIAAGATKVPVQKYLLAVWLGKIIKFGFFAYLGSWVNL